MMTTEPYLIGAWISRHELSEARRLALSAYKLYTVNTAYGEDRRPMSANDIWVKARQRFHMPPDVCFCILPNAMVRALAEIAAADSPSTQVVRFVSAYEGCWRLVEPDVSAEDWIVWTPMGAEVRE